MTRKLMTQPSDPRTRLLPYFDTLHELIEHLHHESHQVPSAPGSNAASVIQVIQALCDVMLWFSNSNSFHMQNLQAFDKIGLANELDDKVLWRLNHHATANDATVRDSVDDGDGDAH